MRMKKVFINKVFFGKEHPLEGLEKEKHKEFLKKCDDIFGADVFKKIYDYLVSQQILFVARKAENELQTSFGRGSINGLDIFFQEMKQLSDEYRILVKATDEMTEEEKYSVI